MRYRFLIGVLAGTVLFGLMGTQTLFAHGSSHDQHGLYYDSSHYGCHLYGHGHHDVFDHAINHVFRTIFRPGHHRGHNRDYRQAKHRGHRRDYRPVKHRRSGNRRHRR